MKQLARILNQEDAFSEIMMGNSAIVRAMIEANTKVVTSYPGSPTPEIASTIAGIKPEDRPFYFEFSTNEKVATEVAAGASVNGHLSTVFFKSVGLNVAADSFVQLGLFNLQGGMVIVLGDDPGANSSQNEQDNRHICRMSYIPILEPSNPQEVYEMYLAAAKLSQKLMMPVVLRLSTHVCHAKEKVNFSSWKKESYDWKPKFDPKTFGPYIPITSIALQLKERALKRFEEAQAILEESPFHKVLDNKNLERGIITMGLPFYSLMDALQESQAHPDILSLATPYPLPRKKIIEFLKKHKEVKVFEELDPIVEQEIKVIAFEEGIQVKIIGKTDLTDWTGEYTADKIQQVLHKTWPDLLPLLEKQERPIAVANRPAQMCPGCGHRSAFHAIKNALTDEDITVADIGCHTLGFMEPYNMGQILMSMGASPAIASGLALGNKSRRVVAFIGDSTFFHAGIPSTTNALFNKHNITLILMENGTTAMTGHQDHPGVGKNFNEETAAISPKDVLRGLGVEPIVIDAYQQAKITQAILDGKDKEGLQVIIATHPCMLKFTREAKKKDNYTLRQVSTNPEKCQGKTESFEKFACPAFHFNSQGHFSINTDLCIGDGSCIQTAPKGAINPPKAVTKN